MLVGCTEPQFLAMELLIGLLEFPYDSRKLTFPEQVIPDRERERESAEVKPECLFMA